MSRYDVNVILYRLKKDAAFRARFRADAGAALGAADLPRKSGTLSFAGMLAASMSSADRCICSSPFPSSAHTDREGVMDWLEQLFGLNPDGGDGSVETMIVVAVIVGGVTVAGLVSKRVRALGLSALHLITSRSKSAR